MSLPPVPDRPSADPEAPADSPCWQNDFAAMIPKIEGHARFSFRDLVGDDRDEAVQETVCNACVAYSRLVEQGRPDACTWSSLAKFAVRQVRSGRIVGGSLNVNDVTSPHCRRRKGATVQPLCRWDERRHEWREMLVEDKTCSPAELAAGRIDFPAFLDSLSHRDRCVAETLATGESTGRVAQLFGLSAGRISHLRRELKRAWEQFHEPSVPEAALSTA